MTTYDDLRPGDIIFDSFLEVTYVVLATAPSLRWGHVSIHWLVVDDEETSDRWGTAQCGADALNSHSFLVRF